MFVEQNTEIKKYLELNDNNIITKFLWYAALETRR